MESQKKSNKKFLFILIPIIAVLAAGGLIVGLNAKNWFGHTNEPAETESPTEVTVEPETDEPYEGDQLPVYFNVDLDYYKGMSEGGLSSRKKEADGFYHFILSANGKQIEAKTSDTRLMNVLDSREFSCVEIDDEGIIQNVYDPEACQYKTVMEDVYIFDATDTTLTVNTEEFFSGFTYAVTSKTGFTVYDTANTLDPAPEVTLEKGMLISIFKYRPTGECIVFVYPLGDPAENRFYWNINRKWNSEIKNTTREPNADGEYEFLLACNGEQVTVKVRDFAVVQEMDGFAAKCFVLSFDKDGYAVKAQSPAAAVGGKSAASWHHIMSFLNEEQTAFHARKTQATASDYRHEQDVTLAADCQVYNVSSYVDDHVGEVTTLRTGDQVHCILDHDGQAILIYVVSRKFPSKLYWNVSRKYNSTTKETSRKPNAAGYYEFLLAVDGHQVTYKTADKAIATKLDAIAAKYCGLKVEGDIIKEVYTPGSSTVDGYYGSAASWYHIVEFQNKDNTEFKAKRLAAGTDYGKSTAIIMAEDCEVYNVSGFYDKYVGEPTTLQLDDQIHVNLDAYGHAKLIYVVSRYANVPIYWNVTRKYNSTTGETTRTAAEDGYYYFTMATEGKQVEVRATKEIANTIDSFAARNMGLFLASDGKTVTKAISGTYVKDALGGSVSSWCDILTLTSTSFRSQKLDDPKSSYYLKTYDVNYNSATKIYNCTTFFDTPGDHFVGEKTTLRVGDKVHVLLNKDKIASYIFVVGRSYADTGHKDSHVCYDCGQNVTWTAWKSGTSLPTATGHYYLCGNIRLTGAASVPADQNVVLCLNGYTVDGPETNRIYTASGTNSSITVIGEQEGSALIGHYKGTAVSGGVLFGYKGNVRMVGGLIDATDVVTEDKASAVFTYAPLTTVLSNVTIKGGKAGSRGALSVNNGSFVILENVTFDGGKSGTNHEQIYVDASGSLTLKGTLTFKNTEENGSAIYLVKNAKLTLDGLTATEGATVVMAAGSGKFTANYEEGAEALFTATGGKVIGIGDGTGLVIATGPATDISLSTESLTLRQLQTAAITAEALPESASNRILEFSSSDPTVVTVDNEGHVAAQEKDGTAEITVKTADNAVSKVITVTVSGAPAEATSLEFAKANVPLFAGASEKLTVTIQPAEANYLKLTFTSSNENVALVSEDGTVTAVGAGTATITVTPERGACSATCTVEVQTHEHMVCGKTECTAEGHDHTNPAWVAWTDAASLPAEDGYWYLATDVSVSAQTNIAGKTVVLDLAGHTVNSTAKVFHLTEGASLVITDCVGTGTIKETASFGTSDGNGIFNIRGLSSVTVYNGILDATGVSTGYGPVAYIHNDGANTFTVYGGTIKGGTALTNGGAFWVGDQAYLKVYGGTIEGGSAPFGGAVNSYGNVELYGGLITGGTAESNGGNLSINGGTLLIDGGTVSSGNATTGANIYMSKGNAEMKSGTLENGNAKSYGGNMTIYGSSAVFTMTGGTIANGTVKSDSFSSGGNVNITSAKFYMKGGLVTGGQTIPVTNKTGQHGGNFAMDGSNALLEISGGRVENGHANSTGGNVYLHVNTSKETNVNTFILSGDAVITGGTARQSGNVLVDTQGVFTMEGGTISDGTAQVVGSDGGFGGNVAVRGTFTMNGGTISGGKCIGNTGGNVSLWQTTSRFIMNGGLITGGEREGSLKEGGVSIFYNAKLDDAFVMTGGEISGNAGGVYVSTGNLILSGNAVIKNNGMYNVTAKGETVLIGGALTEGAEIYLTLGLNELFAASETDYSQYFHSDDPSYVTAYDQTNGAHKFTKDYSNTKLDIYMLAGQSNASGSSAISKAEETDRDKNVYENVRYYYYRENTDGTVVQNRTTFEAVKEGMGYATGYIGPELGMAAYLNSLYEDEDKEALIFKYAAGGTSLLKYTDENGVIQNTSSQTGDSVDRYKQRGSWYPTSLLSAELQNAINEDPSIPSGFLSRGMQVEILILYLELLDMGYKPENIRFVSVCWMQGGEDRKNPDPYPAAFKAFTDEIRATVSYVTQEDYSTLPFVVGEIAETFSSASSANIAINQAFIAMQDSLPGIVNDCYVIPTRSFALSKWENGENVVVGTDTSHWSYKDMLVIGRMFAEMSYLATNDTSSLHMHCLCGNETLTAGEHAHAKLIWKEWNNATALPTESGNWYLTTDVTISAQTALAGKAVNLDLNGHTVTSTAKVFHLTAGSTLNITDCTGTGTIKETATFGNTSGNGIFNIRGGSKVAVYAGTLDATGVKTGYGTIAYVNGDAGDSFTIYGGTIKSGKALTIGGAFWMGEKSDFILHGGEIIGNEGPRGGVVYTQGNVLITGGSITGGKTVARADTSTSDANKTSDRAGGIFNFCGTNKTFIMTGGTISGGSARDGSNTSDLGGNLALLGSGNRIELSGGTISGGTANCGGNIYIRSGSASAWNELILSGVTIENGYAVKVGGNVEARRNAYVLMTGGSLLNGFAKDTNGGQVSVRGAIFRITDGTVGAAKSGSKGSAVAEQVDSDNQAAGVILIDGGSVSAVQGTSKGGTLTYGEETFEGGLVRVTAGQITSVTFHNSKVVIEGGTIGTANANGATDSSAGKIIINGGFVKTLTKTNARACTFEIQGGTFVSDPTAYLVNGALVTSGDFTNTDTSDTTVYKYRVTPSN